MSIEAAGKARLSSAAEIERAQPNRMSRARRLPSWLAMLVVGALTVGTWGCDGSCGSRPKNDLRAARAGILPQTDSTPVPSSTPVLDFEGNRTVIGPPNNYAVFLQRERNCSLTENFISTSSFSYTSGTVETTPVADFQETLHSLAGLTTRAGLYPGGCKDAEMGIPPRYGAYLGMTKDGTSLLGAFIDYNNNLYLGSADLTSGKYSSTQKLSGNALSVLAADVNGDGLPDLLVQSFTTSGGVNISPISIYLNNGNGTFKSAVTVPNTNSSGAWTVDDFNGDGKADLVFAEYGIGIVFLKGNGNGTFGAPVTSKIVENAEYMASGEFTADKKKDLVMSNGAILLGNGDGSFTAGTAITLPKGLGNVAQAPVVGDWNNDGKQDLAFENSDVSGGTVNIFLGKGDGTFTQGKSYATIGGAFFVSAADLDGDGNQDLIVGEANGGVFGPDWNSAGFFQALMGRGNGTFVAPEALPGLNAFAVGNFRSSTLNDLLVTSSSGIQLYENSGKAEFTPGTTIDVPGAFNVTVADMNGGGKQDAVFAENVEGTYEIAVAPGNGDGGFETPITFPLPSSIQIGSSIHFSLVDLNGDKKPDVLLAVNGDLSVMLNDGKGNLGTPVQVASEDNNILGIVIGDFNKDGKTDVAFAESTAIDGTSAGAVVVMLGKGNGSFEAPEKLTMNYSPASLAAADMNKDGKLDLVVTSANKSNTATNLYVLLGKGNGTFDAPTTTALNYPYATGISVADFDGDGNPDVLVGACCGATYTTIAFGKGDGTFSALRDLTLASSAEQVQGIDMNGDGKPDAVIASSEAGGFLTVLLNTYPTVVKTTATTTTLKSSLTSGNYGTAVTLTATVKAKTGTAIPSGKVTFLSGKTTIGTATLSKSGEATLETTKLPAGTDSITASYGGSSAFAESVSAAVDVKIAADATTTTLTASSLSVTRGALVTFTATVKAKTGTQVPGGKVTFLHGKAVLGSATLSAGKGTLKISSLPAGSDVITATYAASADFAASTSTAVTVKVTAP